MKPGQSVLESKDYVRNLLSVKGCIPYWLLADFRVCFYLRVSGEYIYIYIYIYIYQPILDNYFYFQSTFAII